ncbi:MAG: DUF494 family protein [bacterium]
MDNRIVEIIVAIVDKLIEVPEESCTVEEITNSLLEDGFTAGEISDALAWLYYAVDDRLLTNGRIAARTVSRRGLRVLSEFEKSVISPEAYGYILQLTQLGLLDDLQIEDLIERAIVMCTETVEVADIKQVLPTILLEASSWFSPVRMPWISGEQIKPLPH